MSYQIRVNCDCGKILKIPEKYAGKKGRCPNCGKKISIPSLEDLKSKPAEQTPLSDSPNIGDRQCPTCGAFLNKGDTVCVSCHTNLSTGEWEVDSYKETSPWQGNLKAIGALTFVGVLACIALTVVIYRWLNKPVHMPLPTTSTEISTIQENDTLWATIVEMPDNDMASVEAKSKALAEFSHAKFPNNLLDLYEKLQQKRQDLLVRAEIEKYTTENALTQYKIIRGIPLSFVLSKETLVTEQKKIQEIIAQELDAQANQMQEMLASNQYDAVLSNSLDYIEKLAAGSLDDEIILQKFRAFLGVNRNAMENVKEQKRKMDALVSAPSQELSGVKLTELKDSFNNFLIEYRKLIGTYQFTDIITQLDPIKNKALELQKEYPDDTDIAKILETYTEAKLLETVWSHAVEGADALASSKDANDPSKARQMVLFSRKGAPISGIMTKYANGELTLDKNQKKEMIKLVDLTPRSIAQLALTGNEKKPELYQALTAFYFVTNEDALCNEAADASIKLGILPTNIERYQKWALAVLEEKKRKIEVRNTQLADEQRAETQRVEESRLEKLRQDASILIKQLLEDYKANKDQVVLEYLYTLKMKVGDKPGGRDELIKLNYILKKEEGHSLSTIASNAYSRCPFCRNEGEIKCPDCKGEGYIQDEERWLAKDDKSVRVEGKKHYCQRCKGTGEIDCPYCVAKRQDRRYIMIKDYYGSF